jgi:hypothetical protein
LDLEEDAKALLVPNTEFLKIKPWNGSEENMMELFTIDGLF